MQAVTIGIVGLDNWYHGLPFAELAATTPGARLAAVSDSNPKRQAWIRERYPSTRLAESHEAVLTDPAVDAVLVLTPTSDHAAHAEAAARNGKHLLCDKPLGLGATAARRIVDAYASGGLKAATIFGRRARPLFREVKRSIESGEIGRVICAVETGRFGLPRAEPSSPDPGWYADPARSGGGGFLDHAVHQTDMFRALLGADVTGVKGSVSKLRHPDLRVEDYGIATLTFSTGAVVTIESSWIAEGPSTAMIYIEGTAGSIRWDDAAKTVTIRSRAGERTVTDKPGRFLEGPGWRLGMSGYGDVFQNFIDCVRGDAKPLASLADGLRAVEVTDAVYGRA